jgi:hypothetical protein
MLVVRIASLTLSETSPSRSIGLGLLRPLTRTKLLRPRRFLNKPGTRTQHRRSRLLTSTRTVPLPSFGLAPAPRTVPSAMAKDIEFVSVPLPMTTLGLGARPSSMIDFICRTANPSPSTAQGEDSRRASTPGWRRRQLPCRLRLKLALSSRAILRHISTRATPPPVGVRQALQPRVNGHHSPCLIASPFIH